MAKKKLTQNEIKNTPVAEEEVVLSPAVIEEMDKDAKEPEVSLGWLVERIVTYCEKQAGITLHPYQREYAERIVQSIIENDGDEITALFSRQSGKTETTAVIMAGIMVIIPRLAQLPQFEKWLGHFKNGVWIGLFAPSKEQAFTTFSRCRDRIRSKNAELILNDPEIDTTLDKESNPMMLSNGSLLRMHSAAKQSQIESKTYHILIVEEAQDVDKTKLLKSIHPMGASTNATILKIGTPNNKRCEFYETITRNKRSDETRKKNERRSHYEFDYQVVQKYNPKYKKYIEKEKQRLGEDSDEFRMSYRLEWILERGMFLSPEMLDSILDKSLKHEISSRKYCAAGIDLAKKNDSSVITVVEVDFENGVVDTDSGELLPRIKVLNWLEMTGNDYEYQYNEIMDFLHRYNVKSVYVDATGVGTPVADRLKYALEDVALVVPFEFTTPSKSQMWKTLQNTIYQGRLKVPAHAKTRETRPYRHFIEQMQSLEKDWKGQHMVCNHPKDDKNAHDDFCDSLGMAVLAAHQEAMPEIQVADNPFYERSR